MKDHINQQGFIESEGHKIYWEDWGNPKADPIFYMHGGPGGGCDESDKELFDPKKHRVIFHDQRGSGRSTPFASTEKNTTQDLIADIEKIRSMLGIEKMYITGGSWGSALSIFYSIAHPERVRGLLLWGLFLSRQFEIDFVNEGYPRYFFPDAWERFISLVPQERRKTGNDVMKYYSEMLDSPDTALARKHADEWTIWEYTLCSIDYDPKKLESDIKGDVNTVAIAQLEMHYFLNRCFVPEGYVFDNIAKIKDIPCTVVQGRFDMCTPAISAYELSKVYGNKFTLKWANSGHMKWDPEMFKVLKESVLEMIKGR